MTFNTLNNNPITNTTTSRTLSRPPLSLIQNNPLSYNLTSTNFHSQPSSNTTQYNTNIQSSSQFNNHIPPNTIQTNLHVHPTSIQPQANTLNIPQNSFNSHITHTIPSSTTPLSTLNTPTYINSSASISEPIKPFDSLDHNYTPEEYLQHIFIQCSLTGTDLSWYIRLNDTYKQDWHAFVQALKKPFSSQKNAYYAQVESLSLI